MALDEMRKKLVQTGQIPYKCLELKHLNQRGNRGVGGVIDSVRFN